MWYRQVMNTLSIKIYMDYSKLVGLIKERNRPSGGIKSVHTVAVNTFMTPDKLMLEIGCNTGFTSVNMALLTGAKVIGIDINENSIELSKSYALDMGVDLRTEFIQQSALDLDFENNKFDVVWASNVASFIGEKEDAIKEYIRVLKTGGFLVAIPIYYASQPPANIVEEVSKAIGTTVTITDKNYWVELYKDTAKKSGSVLELVYDQDSRYNNVDSEIDDYVTYIIEKSNISGIPLEEVVHLHKLYSEQMNLFNKNLKYCNFSILIFQKRHIEDEWELFKSSTLQLDFGQSQIC